MTESWTLNSSINNIKRIEWNQFALKLYFPSFTNAKKLVYLRERERHLTAQVHQNILEHETVP